MTTQAKQDTTQLSGNADCDPVAQSTTVFAPSKRVRHTIKLCNKNAGTRLLRRHPGAIIQSRAHIRAATFSQFTSFSRKLLR